MASMTARILQLFRDNGAYLGTALLLDYLRGRIRSWMIGRYFKAPLFRLGSGYEIRGARYIEIGERFYCRQGLWLEAVHEFLGLQYQPRLKIGDDVSCSQNVHISCARELVIGNHVLIGSSVYIGDHNHGTYRGSEVDSPEIPPSQRTLSIAGPLIIEDNVFIGDKVTIVGGLRVGRGTIIAANSVVNTSLPPMCMVAGVPARIIKRFDTTTGLWTPVRRDKPE